jgi:hypothetical protein
VLGRPVDYTAPDTALYVQIEVRAPALLCRHTQQPHVCPRLQIWNDNVLMDQLIGSCHVKLEDMQACSGKAMACALDTGGTLEYIAAYPPSEVRTQLQRTCTSPAPSPAPSCKRCWT